ncbi:hypothetical protein ACWEOE_04600 [Amycolatopsis sp. NPDC004368]
MHCVRVKHEPEVVVGGIQAFFAAWLGRYDGLAGGPDGAHAIAMTTKKDGVRFYVTGQSSTAGSLETGVEVEMTTIAYVDPWQQ